MKFTLITACFNSEKTIRDTIASVLVQKYSPIEYIIIDGGSSDGTMSIVREYSDRIQKIVSEPDSGLYNAMNKGIALATGDVIGIINSDDFYPDENVLSSVAEEFLRKGVDSTFGDLEYVDAKDPSKVRRIWRAKEYWPGAFRTGWHPPHPTFFARKDVYEKLGGFDESFRISSDYELMVRFLEGAKISCSYIPSTLVKMREGGVSNRTLWNILRANFECFRALRKNGIDAGPFVMLKKPLSKLSQILRARRA